MVLALGFTSSVDWYLHEVYWKYHEQISIYSADTKLCYKVPREITQKV